LHKLLLNWRSLPSAEKGGALQLMLVERRARTLVGAAIASLFGKLGHHQLTGVHVERGDEIVIEGDRSSVILDGELFEARKGQPIVLTPTAPVPFLSLAA